MRWALVFGLAAVICFWVTVAGLITATPELRTFGALATGLLVGSAWLADRFRVEPAASVESDWQWPARIEDA